jgi:hypothetical protein
MAEDAIPLDGTRLTFQQQVDRIVALARDRMASSGPPHAP